MSSPNGTIQESPAPGASISTDTDPPTPPAPQTPSPKRSTATTTGTTTITNSASSTSTTISDYVPPTPDVSGQWYIDNMDTLEDTVIESQTAAECVTVARFDRRPERRFEEWRGVTRTG
ncbi:hypothetical protein ABW21_db0206554 [Orbilia brochopaga]|nr:hypothetical protein ABW21_db0206554 [Drechslerella brochopaga]